MPQPLLLQLEFKGLFYLIYLTATNQLFITALTSTFRFKLSQSNKENLPLKVFYHTALDSPIVHSVHIDMEVSPSTLSMIGSHNSSDVFEGKNVTVTCVATGAKPPAYIYWNSDPELFQV